jgi:formylmethanofuran dehydrogenase subunit B
MLLRGEVDACVLVGSQGIRRFEPDAVAALLRVPTIVLDGPDTLAPFVPTVRFTTAVPGVHLAGTAYRMDEIPIPLRAVLPAKYPSDAVVLAALLRRCASLTTIPPAPPA